MAEIIAVRFKREGKQYYFDPQGLEVKLNVGVIVETSWGMEFGTCVRSNSQVSEDELVAPLRPVVRIATEEDLALVEENHKKEDRAFGICVEKIAQHGLDMKLVDVEYGFEGSKILFFFTSEGRVDFRALVKDLASIFHNRIELRQIGVRDEAKMLGGLGICGRPFCCSSFLREFQPVSIKMAKTQNLSLNPTKISGTCGRLMCCLKYEQEAYEDLLKNSPKEGSFVVTPDGIGDIISTNVLREKVRVRLDHAPDTLNIYRNSEVRVLRWGKGKRPEDYELPSKQEMEAMRHVDENANKAKVNSFDTAADHLPSHVEEKSQRGRARGQQRPQRQKQQRTNDRKTQSTNEQKAQQGNDRKQQRANEQKPQRGNDRKQQRVNETKPQRGNDRKAQRPMDPKAQQQVEPKAQQPEEQATQTEQKPARKPQQRRYNKAKSKQIMQKAQPKQDEVRTDAPKAKENKPNAKNYKKPYWKHRKPNKPQNPQKPPSSES